MAVGRGHASAVTKVAIGPGNGIAVSGSDDGSVFVWDLAAAGVPRGGRDATGGAGETV